MPQKKLYRYFLLIQVFLWQLSYAQEYSKDTLFDKFRNDILIEQEQSGRSIKWDNETREHYYSLVLTHPVQFLIKYTEDSIPAIRAEIFAALVHKSADDHTLKEILNRHVNDTARFYEGTCAVSSRSVNEYMQFLLQYKADNKLPEIDYEARLAQIRRERPPYIAGAHHNVISRDSLSKADHLIFAMPAGCKITSILLNVRKKEMTSRNEYFTKRMKRKIRRLKSGERLFIDDIQAQGPDKITRHLGSISLIVK